MNDKDTNERIMSALFNEFDKAENSYKDLLARGFERDQITVLMSDELRKKHYGTETEMGTKAAEGTGVGAAVGGTVGAIIGAVAAVGSTVVIPGAGIVIAGPLAFALAGAGTGGIAGGLMGVLIGAGIPEETVKRYETAIGDGGIVLGFNPKNEIEANEVEKVWKDNNADHIYR
ncbi:MAG: hypothetical protein KDB79_14525 [Acidobacteria bacterium]|nr:hypothetical protein [Acidobacteriota bacterium]